MKRNTLVILLIVLALILTVPAAFAQLTFPTGGTSGIQAVNLDTTAATISATYYAEDGTPYALTDVVLENQGDSYTYYAEPDVTTFAGSAILSADKQIAAIANTGFSSNNSGGAYGGSNTGATTVLLPLVTKAFGGQTTAIGIQNTDTAAAVVAQVTYTPQGGTAFVIEYTLQPGASQIVDLGLNNADFSDGWIGSASISPADGSTPLVASAMIYTTDFVFAYSGFTNTGTQWYLPLIRSNFASQLTGVQVVNATASDVDVTMNYNGTLYNSDYSVAGAYTCTVNATLPGSGSVTFYNLNTWDFDNVLGASAASVTGGDCNSQDHANFQEAGDMFLGSATVTTNGEVAVMVNDLSSSGGSSGAYNGFLATEAAASVISPLARVNFYGITSGTQVQNICGSAVTAEATYQTGSASENSTVPVLDPATIDAGSSYTFFTNDSSYDGWLGSVTVSDTSTTDGSNCLVGITNDAPDGGDASLFNTFAMP